MGQQYRQFKLDLSDYAPEEREAIALEVIERIIKRTKSGIDKNGEKFPGYSEAYKKSLAFKIAGKSSNVNLTLSGDMLDDLEILENYANGKVLIGYSPDSSEGGKAEGNIRGTYGDESRSGPKRDFLGITDQELESILKKYGESESKKAQQRAYEKLTTVGESKRLSGKIDLEDLDE